MTKYCKTICARDVDDKSQSRLIKAFKCLFSKKTTIVAIIGAFVVSFIFYYIIQINNFATDGFEVRKLEDQISALKDENKHLEFQVVELQSMTGLRERAQKLNLVDASDIRYIEITGASLAQR
jgi:cell division protein FtsL